MLYTNFTSKQPPKTKKKSQIIGYSYGACCYSHCSRNEGQSGMLAQFTRWNGPEVTDVADHR